jgi:branched-chain amino acid transport system substrate-binding protein
MFLSQAIDTGYFAQQVRQIGSDISMYSVSWSMTKDLITNGGQAVEGMRMIGIFQPQTPSESQLKFEEDFENRYSYKPSFIAHFSYDTIHMLIDAIEDADSDDAKEVKTSLLNGELYEGIYENLKFNEYGDSNRRYLIHKIVDGEFVPQY